MAFVKMLWQTDTNLLRVAVKAKIRTPGAATLGVKVKTKIRNAPSNSLGVTVTTNIRNSP